ncbi:MAG: hypothetical protein IJQ39_08450 [Thermoguttaceae bacterium]|nr:hypothetical protein [Thermoguttaceae bacterium]
MKKILILIVLLLSSTVMAEDWSAQLQSPIPALRDRAEKQLIELGPDSGVALPDANQPGLPADVKRRIERIRRAWDERSALAFLEPSSVENLPVQSLRAWLEAAEKKTGNPIDFKRLDDKLLDAPIERPQSTLFWKAMDELVQRYGLNYSWFERPKAVRLTPQSGNREWGIGNSNSPAANLNPTPYSLLPTPSIFYPGAFRFELQEWSVTVRPADPSSSTIRTGLILAWEPRLRPIYIDILPKMQYADGTVKTGESIQILAGEGLAKPMDFIFPLSSENGKRPETLSGDLSVVIAGEQKTFTFTIPTDSKPQSLRKDQAVVVVKAVGSRQETVEANIAIEFDESYNGLRSYMTWLNYNKAYAVDSEGKRYASSSWETVWQSDRGAEVKYYFTVPSNAKIRQIEYFSPTAIRRIDYSFKFEDFFPEKF